MLSKLTRYLAAPAFAVTVLAACGGSGTDGSSAAGGGECDEPTKITYRLNWIVDYEQVPYYVAKDKGFYEDQCLDVTIQPGRGSADTTTLVASGTAQVGVADAVAVMQGQAKGLPVTGVAVAWRKNTSAVFIRNKALDDGTTDPKPTDLDGMTFGAVTTGSPYIFWKAFANKKNLDLSKIHEVSVKAPGYAEMSSGKVDFIATFADVKPILESRGVPVTLLKFADFGQQGYGLSIIANDAWLQDNPEAMKGFLIATARGMAWSANHPKAALKIEAKTNPSLTKSPEAFKANLAGFKADASVYTTDAPMGKGTYLAFEEDRLKSTRDILYDGGVLKGQKFDVTEHWTQKYVPDHSTYRKYQQSG